MFLRKINTCRLRTDSVSRFAGCSRLFILAYFMPNAFSALIRIRYQCCDCQANLGLICQTLQLQCQLKKHKKMEKQRRRSPYAFLPLSWSRGAFLKWLRRTHAWLGLSLGVSSSFHSPAYCFGHAYTDRDSSLQHSDSDP